MNDLSQGEREAILHDARVRLGRAKRLVLERENAELRVCLRAAYAEADRLKAERAASRSPEAVERENEILRGALEDLAGEYDCTVVIPPDDPSEPSRRESCREKTVDTELWCYACVASAALDATSEKEKG